MAFKSKQLYSLSEAYRALYRGARSHRALATASKNGQLSAAFKERIMLAVTEVNNCPMCSYAHTKMALESGMSNQEIESMLAGTMGNIPQTELAAILFAQHYAETRGNPSCEAWKRLTAEYGPDLSHAILGAIQTITIGNTYGIPMGSLKNRFKGKADSRSSLLYELAMLFSLLLFLPAAFICAGIAAIARRPVIRCQPSTVS